MCLYLMRRGLRVLEQRGVAAKKMNQLPLPLKNMENQKIIYQKIRKTLTEP